MAQRLWTYSFTPPASPERLEKGPDLPDQHKPSRSDSQDELKYVLVDRGSLASLCPLVEESKEPSVPIPSFRKVEQIPMVKNKVRSVILIKTRLKSHQLCFRRKTQPMTITMNCINQWRRQSKERSNVTVNCKNTENTWRSFGKNFQVTLASLLSPLSALDGNEETRNNKAFIDCFWY